MSSGASLTSWGEGASLALAGDPSSDGVTKMLCGVDVLHWPVLYPHLFLLGWLNELKVYLSISNQSKLNELWSYYQKHVNQIIFESHNSLKLSFTNIQGRCSNFVDCKSFLESNSNDIIALCETNLDDSIDSYNFSMRGYLPLIWKDSGSHMHSLTVYVKEGLYHFLFGS